MNEKQDAIDTLKKYMTSKRIIICGELGKIFANLLKRIKIMLEKEKELKAEAERVVMLQWAL